MDATSQSSTLPRIVVLGLTGGWADLKAAEIVATTDLLVGGNRQLDTFPHFDGEKLAITRNIAEVVAVIKEARSAGRRVTVLASGDPLCYGIGATLRRSFSAESLHIIPALSSIQLAFSRLAEPWHDAHIISAHGRDNRLALLAIMTHPKTAVLTDRHNSPDALASRLSEMGLPESTSCAVCEQLGSPDEKIWRLTVGEVAQKQFDPLNVMVVWNTTPRQPQSPHLLDSAFDTERQQITKKPIRQAVLSEIGLLPHDVMWDIGSGSGSVAIEAARLQPTARVFAVEQSPDMAAHWRNNATRHGAFNAELLEATAPLAFDSISYDPNIVFIGGSGGRLGEIIDAVCARLGQGGRIVATFATLENLQLALQKLPEATAYQMQVNDIRPIGSLQRLAAHNPVFILRWKHK